MLSTDAAGLQPRQSVAMSSLNMQMLGSVVAVASAGLLMGLAGTGKKLLRWKPADRRCSTCGRTIRAGCPCRR